MKQKKLNVYSLTTAAVMAALVYIVTLFRFPLLGSKVHFANAVCLVAGMLLGPVMGGTAAGLGSALYDALAGGYDLANVLITYVSKFAMAWVAGMIVRRGERQRDLRWTLTASVSGALTYVALYMLKTLIYQCFVYRYPMDAVWATMVSKLIPSLINAGAAIIAAPLFLHAVMPVLRSAGILGQLRGNPMSKE